MRPRLVIALAGCGVALLAADARAATPGDPFEKLNRRFYASSEGVDRSIVRPLARLYRALTPGPIGIAIHNVVTNLSEPAVVANDILQVRFRSARHDLERLALNTSFGMFGIFDVATPNGLPHHDNDFGVTLGRWGVGPGPYLYLPFLGPSTVRDAVGHGVDAAAAPLNYVRFPGRITLDISMQAAGGLDMRNRAQADLDALLEDADDPYATLRSVYLQSRAAAIRGEDETPTLSPADAPSAEAAPPVIAAPRAALCLTPPAQAPGPDVAAQAPASDDDGVIATARPWDIGARPAHGA